MYGREVPQENTGSPAGEEQQSLSAQQAASVCPEGLQGHTQDAAAFWDSSTTGFLCFSWFQHTQALETPVLCEQGSKKQK